MYYKSIFSIILVISIISCRKKPLIMVSPISSKNTVELINGAAWGVLEKLSNGDIGLFYQKANRIDSLNSVNISIELIRSKDKGLTWEQPVSVYIKNSEFGKLYSYSDSVYTVFQCRNIAVGQLPGERLICSFGRLDYFYDKNFKSIADSKTGNVFLNRGIYYCISDDNGKTWTTPAPINDIGKVTSPSVHFQIVSLSNNVSLMSVYGYFDSDNNKSSSGILRSLDNGLSWHYYSTITVKNTPPYGETSLLKTRNNIQAYIRTANHNIEQFISSDNGITWSQPKVLTESMQIPAGPVLLKNDKVLLLYGNRKHPYGAGGLLSFNLGLKFDTTRKIHIANATGPNCGYPNGIQLDDGKVLITYYDMPIANSQYANNWLNSKIYLTTFTEDELLASYK